VSTWWNETSVTTGATNTDIGKGYSNTKKIVKAQGDSGHYAERRCWNSKASGYKDWFLPSKDELNELYKQKVWLADLLTEKYWSSTATLRSTAWAQYFSTGRQDSNLLINAGAFVRAIRAFSFQEFSQYFLRGKVIASQQPSSPVSST
jgi:hypothetical protein